MWLCATQLSSIDSTISLSSNIVAFQSIRSSPGASFSSGLYPQNSLSPSLFPPPVNTPSFSSFRSSDEGPSENCDYLAEASFLQFRENMNKNLQILGEVDADVLQKLLVYRMNHSLQLLEACRQVHIHHVQTKQTTQGLGSSFPPFHGSPNVVRTLSKYEGAGDECDCFGAVPAIELFLVLLSGSFKVFNERDYLDKSSNLYNILNGILSYPFPHHPSRIVGVKYFDVIQALIQV
jgi:hypothetical protein